MLIKQALVKYCALIGLVIFVACLFIGGEQPGAGQLFPAPWDKLAHIAAYCTIGILAGLVFPSNRLFWIVVIVVVIGGTDEIHQIFIPGRQAGFDDWAADWVGALFSLPGVIKLRQYLYTSPIPVAKK